MLDVWQANDEGFYDVQQKGIQPDFNLRGRFLTGEDGRYWFRAVKPKFYPIPDDGPVGKLLERARPASLPSGASPFHPQRRRLRDADHPHLRPARPLHQLGCGVRREGEPARRLPAGRRCGAGEGARVQVAVLGGRLRFRAGAPEAGEASADRVAGADRGTCTKIMQPYLGLNQSPTRPARFRTRMDAGNSRSVQDAGAAHLQVGARIRHARILKGMRMRDLAAAVGCDESMVSKIEAGKVMPSLAMLSKMVGRARPRHGLVLRARDRGAQAGPDAGRPRPRRGRCAPRRQGRDL